MMILYKRTVSSNGNLDASGSPLYHIGESLLSDSLETFMNLIRIDVSLYNIHNRYIESLFSLGRDHHILGLKQSSHHIRNSRLFDSRGHFVHCYWSVSCYQEMTFQTGN